MWGIKMKNILCLAVLAISLSAPAFATSDHEACDAVGRLAQADLRMAKMGINNHAELAGDSERIMRIGMDTAVIFLVVAETMWDNRKTYGPAKAYKVGYRLCMELK